MRHPVSPVPSSEVRRGAAAPLPGRLVGFCAVALAVAACQGRVSPPDGEGDGRGGSGGSAGSAGTRGGNGGTASGGSGQSAGGAGIPPDPVPPSELDALCTKDAPAPRRVMRLSPAEIAASVSGIVSLEPSAFPSGFLPNGVPTKPDPTLSVSRDFLDTSDTIAAAVTAKLVQSGASAVGCAPSDFGQNESCTRAFLTKLTDRAFRGSSTTEDVDGLVALAKDVAGRTGGADALAYAVRATLGSPKALYVTEGIDRASAPGPLNTTELASFLSYRITGGPPSSGLLNALKAQKNITAASLKTLLNDQFGASALTTAGVTFLTNWLNVSELARVSKDLTKHPEATADRMLKLQKEVVDAVSAVASQPNIDLKTLLTKAQSSTLVNDPSGSATRPGLFALPGVIAANSAPDHTNVPKRGRFMLNALFCEVTPPPPPGAAKDLPPLPENASERLRFETIEKQARCAGCHSRVDHVAYAFEAWDEVGDFRTKDAKGNAIDTASVHTVDDKTSVSFKDAAEMMDKLSSNELVQNCFAIQSFRHFARRTERGAADACLLRDLASGARAGGVKLGELFQDALVRIALADRGD